MAKILEWSDKDVKEFILKMLEWAIMGFLKTKVKTESISKEREDIHNKMEILEWKNINWSKNVNGIEIIIDEAKIMEWTWLE